MQHKFYLKKKNSIVDIKMHTNAEMNRSQGSSGTSELLKFQQIEATYQIMSSPQKLALKHCGIEVT